MKSIGIDTHLHIPNTRLSKERKKTVRVWI